MERTSRCTLVLQAQHTHYMEDHTWSIKQSTSLHNIQQQTNNHTQNCQLFHQTIHKHYKTRNTQEKQIH